MRFASLVVLVAFGCGGKTYRGIHYSWQSPVATLDGGVVRIPMVRYRWRAYSTDCGFARIFGVGEHDCVGERSERAGTEMLGTITIDIRTGQCGFVPGGAMPQATSPGADVRLQSGDRTFVANMFHVAELDVAGTTVAIHRQPMAVMPEQKSPPWFDPVPWQIGETHHERTLTQTPDGLVLVSTVGRSVLYFGPDARNVFLLGTSGLAATEGWLFDPAKGWKVAEPGGKVPRATTYVSNSWLMEAEGRYRYVDPRFGTPGDIISTMAPVGSTTTQLVGLRSELRSVLVFDITTRTWRHIRYDACDPTMRT